MAFNSFFKTGWKRFYLKWYGEPYSWRDGEDFMFDETYLHYAENETYDPRIILFCDVARPMKNRLADAFRRAFNRFFVSLSATRNLETDNVGFLNRVFGYVYRARRHAKSFKRANRRLYYVAKFVLVFGTLYLIFFAR